MTTTELLFGVNKIIMTCIKMLNGKKNVPQIGTHNIL